MPHLRFQVSTYHPSMMIEDHIMNTFYLNVATLFEGNPFGEPDVDEQALVDDAATLFAGFRPFPSDISTVTVKVYRMEDAKPRPPLATSTKTVANQLGLESGPREVALCLSYYSEFNRPRSRGRMYIGPYPKSQMEPRPPELRRTELIDLANGIANLGGANVDWNVHSVSDNDFKKVSNSWVDDEWDTMRSRGKKGTVRTVATHAE